MGERLGLPIVILAIGLGLSVSHAHFFTLDNLTNVLNQAALVAIVGFGMTAAIAGGGFDLSVGSVLALSACVGANLVNSSTLAVSVAAALALSAGIGLINGLIITRLRVPTFIATLAMMAIVRGGVLLYTRGRDINIIVSGSKEAAYKFFGGGFFFSLPVPMLIMLAVLIGFYVLLRHTALGRHICAVGSNEEAAVTSGLRVDRIKVVVFTLVGLTAGLASVIQTSQLMGVSGGTSGLGLELEAIAVTVLGGTSLKGGRARLVGTLMGAILLALARNGLNLHGTPHYYQYLVLGVILLLAVSLDGLRSKHLAAAGTWTGG
jgi:ribose transport system permease protein